MNKCDFGTCENEATINDKTFKDDPRHFCTNCYAYTLPFVIEVLKERHGYVE